MYRSKADLLHCVSQILKHSRAFAAIIFLAINTLTTANLPKIVSITERFVATEPPSTIGDANFDGTNASRRRQTQAKQTLINVNYKAIEIDMKFVSTDGILTARPLNSICALDATSWSISRTLS